MGNCYYGDKRELNERINSFFVQGKRIYLFAQHADNVLETHHDSEACIVKNVGHLTGYERNELIDKTTLFVNSNDDQYTWLNALHSDYLVYDSDPYMVEECKSIIELDSGVQIKLEPRVHVYLRNNTAHHFMRTRVGILDWLGISPQCSTNMSSYENLNMISVESSAIFQIAWHQINEATKQSKKNVVIDNLYLIASTLKKESESLQVTSPQVSYSLNSWSEAIAFKSAQLRAGQVSLNDIVNLVYGAWFYNSAVIAATRSLGDNSEN
jgi:hypothetical protein